MSQAHTAIDRNQLVTDNLNLVNALVYSFLRDNRDLHVCEDEVKGHARLVMVEGSREYDEENEFLPFDAWIAQRIVWRLKDFAQQWRKFYSIGQRCKNGPSHRYQDVDLSDLPASTNEADNGTIQESDCSDLLRQTLGRQDAMMFEMRYRDDRSIPEIGKAVGMPEIKVRQSLWRIRKHLRKSPRVHRHLMSA